MNGPILSSGGLAWGLDGLFGAQMVQHKAKPVAKRHHMVSGTLAPLYTVFGLKLGCSGAAAPIGDEVL